MPGLFVSMLGFSIRRRCKHFAPVLANQERFDRFGFRLLSRWPARRHQIITFGMVDEHEFHFRNYWISRPRRQGWS